MAGFNKAPGLQDITGTYFTNESRIPRQYFQIPQDQSEILGRPEAWSLTGLPNLPSKLLKDVKKAHMRKSKRQAPATPQKLISSSIPDGSSRGRVAPARFESQPAEESSHHEEGDTEEDESEEADDNISWPASPDEHLHPPARLPVEELPVMPTPTPIYGKQAPSPRAARPSAYSAPGTRYRAQFATQDRPSSPGSELGLEYQPPRAITDVIVDPVNKVLQTAQPVATPPSAQIVPCTFKENSSPRRPESMEQPQPKRKRLMKKLHFDSSLSVEQGGPVEPVEQTVYMQTSGSATVSSIPAQLAPKNTNHALSKPMRQEVALSSDDSEMPSTGISPARRAKDRTRKEPEHRLSAQAPAAREPQAAPEFAEQQRSSNSEKIPPNGPASQAPFTAFCVAYPDYRASLPKTFFGHLGDFVNAVTCIRELQQLRKLPEFLYDDFIRVFCSDYLDYIDSLDLSSEPLTAIEWYNDNVPEPLYTKRVITRSNLQDVEKAYPDKYRESLRYRMARASSLRLSPASALPDPGSSPMRADSEASAHAEPVESTTRSMAQSRPEVIPQDSLHHDARRVSLAVPTSSSDQRSLPRSQPGTVESIERLRSVSGYVMTMSQSNDGNGDQEPKQHVVTGMERVEIKQEVISPSVAQAPPVPRLSQSTPRFETQAFETQVIDNSQSQKESTLSVTQGSLAEPAAESMATLFDAQVVDLTHSRTSPALADTQEHSTQPPATSTTRFETQVINVTQEEMDSTRPGTEGFETQAPPATSRSIDHDISRIPETVIKRKPAQRLPLSSQQPRPAPTSKDLSSGHQPGDTHEEGALPPPPSLSVAKDGPSFPVAASARKRPSITGTEAVVVTNGGGPSFFRSSGAPPSTKTRQDTLSQAAEFERLLKQMTKKRATLTSTAQSGTLGR